MYGCVGAISYLQKEVSQLQMQLAMAHAEILCIQMQQEPLGFAPAPATSVINGLIPVHPAHASLLTDDVISKVSSDNHMSHPSLHNITNHHHHHDHDHYFTSNNVIQYENLKRESSSLWT